MFGLTKLQSIFLLSKKWLSSSFWFPQVPLAVAAALIGLLHLIPLIEHTLGWHFEPELYAGIRQEMVNLTLWGIPQSAIGALLLIMSLGLLWRSRLAWATCILTIFISMLFHLDAITEPVHWWWITFDSLFLLLLLPAYRRFNRHNITMGTLFVWSYCNN